MKLEDYALMREKDKIARELFVEEQGAMRKQIEIAKSLLETSLSNEEIAKYTNLTIKQIKQIRNEVK